jgi:hypothetical protein
MLVKLKFAILHPFKLFEFLVCRIRSYYYTLFIDDGGGSISIESAFNVQEWKSGVIDLNNNIWMLVMKSKKI